MLTDHLKNNKLLMRLTFDDGTDMYNIAREEIDPGWTRKEIRNIALSTP